MFLNISIVVTRKLYLYRLPNHISHLQQRNFIQLVQYLSTCLLHLSLSHISASSTVTNVSIIIITLISGQCCILQNEKNYLPFSMTRGAKLCMYSQYFLEFREQIQFKAITIKKSKSLFRIAPQCRCVLEKQYFVQ